MPNWCDNRVFLRHSDKSKLDALEVEMNKKHDNGFTSAEPFQHLRPRPEDEADWYNWNVEKWGSKWDADVIDWSREEDNMIALYFNSAWAPPIALYDFLTEEGWEVDAIYHESGMGFAGTYVNGVDDYYEYNIADDDVLETLPEEIVEFAGLEYEREQYLEEREEENRE